MTSNTNQFQILKQKSQTENKRLEHYVRHKNGHKKWGFGNSETDDTNMIRLLSLSKCMTLTSTGYNHKWTPVFTMQIRVVSKLEHWK